MPILKKTDNNLHCLHWAEIRPPQMVSFCKISLVFSFFHLANSYSARQEQTRASQQEEEKGGPNLDSQPQSHYGNYFTSQELLKRDCSIC